MKTSRGDTVCKSENWRNMDGSYTRRQTAIKSAERFVGQYLSDKLRVALVDENHRTLLVNKFLLVTRARVAPGKGLY